MALDVIVASGSTQAYPFGAVDYTYSATCFIPAASIPAVGQDLVTLRLPAANANLLRLVRVKAQFSGGTASTTIPLTLEIGKRASPDPGTPSSTPTPTVISGTAAGADPAATATVQIFTTSSTSGVASQASPTIIERMVVNNNVVGVSPAEIINFPAVGAKPPTLFGPTVLTTADQLVLYMNTTAANGGTVYLTTTASNLTVTLYWTEAPLSGSSIQG